MKYIWYSPQKSKYPLFIIRKFLIKSYGVEKNCLGNALVMSIHNICELIGYSWSGVRSSSFTMLKDLLLRNCLTDQSKILCGASLGRGNESLLVAPGSHDQDGRQAHIW